MIDEEVSVVISVLASSCCDRSSDKCSNQNIGPDRPAREAKPPGSSDKVKNNAEPNTVHPHVISLSINELENIYTLEEEKYLDQVLNLFDEKWNSVSLDDHTVNQTINYCRNGITANVAMDYFQTINCYFRLVNYIAQICNGQPILLNKYM